MNPYTIWFILFAFAAYFIATDESVAKAVFYATKIIQNKFVIFRWWLVHNPATPWARYSMWRRSNKLAKELMKELESRNK
jgi:hypothetical protein